jgi:hypothetical protein
VRNSTFELNRALGGLGGGINIGSGSAVLTNVTIARNLAATAAGGGGINFSAVGVTGAQIVNATIDGNCSGVVFPCGGVPLVGVPNDINNAIPVATGNVLVKDTIVSSFIYAGPLVSTCTGVLPLNSGGNNIDGGPNTCFPAIPPGVLQLDRFGINPLLGPLAVNGGLGRTQLLLPGSPAINTGSNATCDSVDERGVNRPQGPICDVGAVEQSPTTNGRVGSTSPVRVLRVTTTLPTRLGGAPVFPGLCIKTILLTMPAGVLVQQVILTGSGWSINATQSVYNVTGTTQITIRDTACTGTGLDVEIHTSDGDIKTAGLQPLSVGRIQTTVRFGLLRVNVETQGLDKATLALYDLSGKLLGSTESTGAQLAMPLSIAGRPLANGVYLYLLTLRGQDGTLKTVVEKIVILR